ncbi:MAG TPA: SxtJ family membrane protein [Pyrinomonadaceae bacterium]|nr:SxtJ family membrane protein [Pyrinomonadaceae bacterium]
MTKAIRKKSWRVEREFGLIVGGMFLLISVWWLYRGKFHTVTQITLPLGAVLLFLGIVFPRVLFYPNQAWMAFAEGLSYISTRIILAFVYFGVITPIGLIKRMTGWDPLSRRAARSESYWRDYSERQRDPRHYEKMF